MMLVTALLGSATTAKAATVVDLGEMELFKTYSWEANSQIVTSGTFTAPKTGDLKVRSIQDANRMDVYTDAAYTKELNNSFNNDYSNPARIYKVTKGTTYYLTNGPTWGPWGAGSVTLSMEGVGSYSEPLKLSWTSPHNGNVYDLGRYDNLAIKFSLDNFKYGTFTLEAEGADGSFKNIDVEQSLMHVYPADKTQLWIELNEKLKSMLKNGDIEPGKKFRVTINGLQNKDGQNLEGSVDGTLVLLYEISAIPTTAKSTVLPADNKFLSYWAKDDAAGKIVMTFDNDLYSGSDATKSAQAVISYGDIEGDMGVNYYRETLPIAIEGNKLTIDLTGKRRAQADMLTSDESTSQRASFTTISVLLTNVCDHYGYPVQSPGAGTVGSYAWLFDYVEIPYANIVTEFTPASGGSVKNVDNVELYMSVDGKIEFDGFKVAYDNAAGSHVETVVATANTNPTKGDIDSEMIYNIPVTAEMKAGSNVEITLNNLVTYDGYEHSNDVYAKYDGFVLTFLNPAAGSKLEALEADQVIKAKFNYASQYKEMYVMYEIKDLDAADANEAIVKSISWMNRQEDDSYEAVIPSTVKMVQGHRYQVNFYAWESEMQNNYGQPMIGQASAEWLGATAPFRFSDISFVSVTPNTDYRLTAADRTFVVEFDGNVTLNDETAYVSEGPSGNVHFESIAPVEGEGFEDNGTTYSMKWQLTLSESYMAKLDASLAISLMPRDMDGLLVKGTHGTEETSYIRLLFEVAGSFKDFDVMPFAYDEPMELEVYPSLSKFVVMHADGIMDSYYGKKIEVYNLQRQLVATVAKIETTLNDENPSETQNTELILTLDNEITEAGTYVVTFPEGAFTIGTEFNSYLSAAKTVTYVVEGAKGVTVTTDPAEGDVKSLKEIMLTFDSEIGQSWNGSAVTLTNEAGDVVYTFDGESDMEMIAEDPNDFMSPYLQAKLTLPNEITEPGKYTLNIPQGYFLVGASYEYCDPMSFTWNVTGQEVKYPMTVVPAEGEVEGGSHNRLYLTFDEQSEVGPGSGKATLTYTPKVSGARAATEAFTKNLPDAEYGVEWNQMEQDLDGPHTAEGTYEVNFPAGYFAFGSNGEPSPALKVVHTIGMGSVNSVIIVGADVNGMYVVYNLNGVKVLETENADDLKTLTPGLYIVNGLKTYIKY